MLADFKHLEYTLLKISLSVEKAEIYNNGNNKNVCRKGVVNVEIKDSPFSEKGRYSLWLSNENIKKADRVYPLDHCKSRSEFIDRAIRFYCGYVESGIAEDYIADVFVQTLFPKLDNMKKDLIKSVYNMALQLSMLIHFEAASCDYSDEELRQLRNKCIVDIKRAQGVIDFEKAIHYQRGDE